MPIQSPLKNVKVGPFVAPKRTLMDVPEGVLTITTFSKGSALNSDVLLIRKRSGSRGCSSSGVDWVLAENFLVPDTLPEGLSAPGNKLPPKSVTLADIPDNRVFVACSVRNSECSNTWFKYRGGFYSCNSMRVETPMQVDKLLDGSDHWTKMDTGVTPGTIFFVTDWVVQVA